MTNEGFSVFCRGVISQLCLSNLFCTKPPRRARPHQSYYSFKPEDMKNIALSPMLWDAGGATCHVNHQRPHQTWRLMTCLILVLPLCLVIFEQTYGMPRMESTQQITKKETLHIPRTKHTTTAQVTPEVEPTPSSPFSNFVFHGNLPFQDRPSLPPLEILETYISQHSEESLQRDWEASNTDHRVSRKDIS